MPRRAFHPLLLVVPLLLLLMIGGLVWRTYPSFARGGSPHRSSFSPPAGATLVFHDSLSQNVGGTWDAYSSNGSGGSCLFSNGGYLVNEQSDYILSCDHSLVIANFAFQVQMKILQGSCGGITMRGDHAYHFYIWVVCQDGDYSFGEYIVNGTITNIPSRYTTAIRTGLSQTNTLAVIANGPNFQFFINGMQVDSISNTMYTQGSLGLVADFGTQPQVLYKNAFLWHLA